MTTQAQDEGQHTILASQPMWLYATRYDDFLIVYKSVLVPDTDQRLEVVNRLLNTHWHRVLYSTVIKDEQMMFGEGIVTGYRIGDKA